MNSLVNDRPEWSCYCRSDANFCHSGANFQKEFGALGSDISRRILAKYIESQHVFELNNAKHILNTIHQSLVIDDLDFSAEPALLRKFAQQKADLCKDFGSDKFALQQMLALFKHYQLGQLHYGTDEAINRLTDSKFWLRRIRRKTAECVSQIERAMGFVSKRHAIYCGDVSVKRHQFNLQQSQQYLENTYLTNDEGLTIPLSEVTAHTIANPIIRRHELMVRIRGFEEVAQHSGHSAAFVTITTPSRMHVTRASGLPNENYDGTPIKEAQDYLNHVWQLIRAKLGREQISPYGFRVVEPHHDGTPHWHLLLFMPPEHLASFKRIVSHYALLDSPTEKGAQKYRVNFVDIDPSKGTAAGYIAKYIAKSIDGFAVGKDTFGNDSIEVSQRINAWAKTCSIRQFQQIGGPSVTVWRELRRLKGCDTPEPEINDAYHAADSANWAAYCIAMNAVGTPKKQHLLAPYYEIHQNEEIDFNTGEIVLTATNKYRETKKPVIQGIAYRGGTLMVPRTRWKLIQAPPQTHSGGALQGGTCCVVAGASLGLV